MDEQSLIRQYRGLVLFYVADISARLPPWVDRDDLTSAGMLGLLQALRSFDPDRGVGFLFFAKLRIRGAIFDKLRRAHPMGRAALRQGIAVESGPDRIDQVDETPPDAGLLRREQGADLHKAVAALPPRLRFVVNGYYFEHRQAKDLAVDLEVSAPRVSKMHAQALSLFEEHARGHMRVIVFRDEQGLWRWHCRELAGEIVSKSEKGYGEKGHAIQAAKEFGPTNAVIFTDDGVTNSDDSEWDNFRQ
jgi:RNA polymerase sigma factor FliA